ncbi:response regulator transcription factor [candidate division WWE3 bacterium]|uniref:Response regulator transcription factor n=1 Tax=candidate division WWE3 bacterium TaxID=2053526 RepID=A0A955LGW0_UNCKA|nr:response regulator transcription factor [candidate division WWE3 bacterium]
MPDSSSSEENNSNVSKIMVVEDTEELRNAISMALKTAGFDVLSVNDGEEGYVHALRVQPDLLLVDIMTPRMDGLTMIQKLRDDPWGKTAKIIILTNLNNTDFLEKAKAMNVHDYFIKSDWPLRELVAQVKAKLQQP